MRYPRGAVGEPVARTHDRPWRPRDDSPRREQQRLVFLVGSLVLILVLMHHTRRPESWHWLWRVGGGPVSRVPPATGGPPADKGQWDKGRLLPGVEPRYLTSIQDHTVFRPAEYDAWFNLLKVLKAHTEPQLRRFSQGDVGFVELFQQPHQYRGQLVTVRGQARRALYRHAPPNDADVPGYWQVVVRPAGGPPAPLILYCLDLPSRFPTGEGIREEIVARGLFFKNWAFSTDTEIHSFPTLLARTVVWSRPDPVAPLPVPASYMVATLVGTAVVGILVAVWAYRRSRRVSTAARQGGRPFHMGAVVAMLALWQGVPAVAGPDLGAGSSRDGLSGGPKAPADREHGGPKEPGGGTADGAGASPGSSILALAGIDQGLLSQLEDGRPLADVDPLVLLKLLYDVRRLDVAFTDRWVHAGIPWPGLLRDPKIYRGQMFALAGRVTGITRRATPPEWVDRFELARYYRCDVRLGDDNRPAVVLTPQVPRAWPADQPLDERVGTSAMFLQLAKENGHDPRPVFIARRLAWYPDRVDGRSRVHLGMAVLGDLGMDVGLWDHVTNRRPLTAGDREPFFQVLAAVERAGTRQLIRLARRDLAVREAQWRTRREQLTRELASLSRPLEGPGGGPEAQAARARQADEFRKHLAIVDQSLAQAQRGVFPVFPLFNEPDRQFGRLVVLEGTARRIVKIYVGPPARPSVSGAVRDPFRLDHYYEIEMFTDDSQDNPIVFCVRHLPDGLGVGGDVHEPVQIAGFFFKSWAYTREANPTAGGDAADATPRPEWQLAPLIIGREPLRLRLERGSGRSYTGLVAGSLFLLTLLAIWYVLWRNARGDRRYDQRIRKFRDGGVPGVSLAGLGAGTHRPQLDRGGPTTGAGRQDGSELDRGDGA